MQRGIYLPRMLPHFIHHGHADLVLRSGAFQQGVKAQAACCHKLAAVAAAAVRGAAQDQLEVLRAVAGTHRKCQALRSKGGWVDSWVGVGLGATAGFEAVGYVLEPPLQPLQPASSAHTTHLFPLVDCRAGFPAAPAFGF